MANVTITGIDVDEMICEFFEDEGLEGAELEAAVEEAINPPSEECDKDWDIEPRPWFTFADLLKALEAELPKGERLAKYGDFTIQRYEQWFDHPAHKDAQVNILDKEGMLCRACFSVKEDGVCIHSVDEKGYVDWNFHKIHPFTEKFEPNFSTEVAWCLRDICDDWAFPQY